MGLPGFFIGRDSDPCPWDLGQRSRPCRPLPVPSPGISRNSSYPTMICAEGVNGETRGPRGGDLTSDLVSAGKRC